MALVTLFVLDNETLVPLGFDAAERFENKARARQRAFFMGIIQELFPGQMFPIGAGS